MVTAPDGLACRYEVGAIAVNIASAGRLLPPSAALA